MYKCDLVMLRGVAMDYSIRVCSRPDRQSGAVRRPREHSLGQTGNVAQGSTPSDVSPARKDQGAGLSEKDAFKRTQDELKDNSQQSAMETKSLFCFALAVTGCLAAPNQLGVLQNPNQLGQLDFGSKAVSKGLGLGIVVGSSLVKLPQVQKIAKSGRIMHAESCKTLKNFVEKNHL